MDVRTQTTLEEAEVLLSRALEAIPNLTTSGVGVGDERKLLREAGPAAVSQMTTEGQDKLKGWLAAIALCADWIKHLKPTRCINFHQSSYGLKHAVEHWTENNGNREYIPNGCFIAAAVGLGYRFKSRDLNAWFNFHQATLKQMMAQSAFRRAS